MKPISSIHAASTPSSSQASHSTGTRQSVTAGQHPLTRAAFERNARFDYADDASIGIDTCGWYEGTAVTCGPPATCAFSSTFRACCVGDACSSSAFNTACLPYDDPACLAGTPGPATKCCTDASSPACLTLYWPTTPPAAPDLTVFTMVGSCVPPSHAGQGVMVTTPPPPPPPPPGTPALPSTRPSSSPPLLKPPAGTILEAILGATTVSAVVIITCVIAARKARTARAARGVAPRADASRSSLTVSAPPGQDGQEEADVSLSARPGTVPVRPGRESKAGRPRDGDGDGRCGSDAVREQGGVIY